jgi:ABC-type lipoprotein release transport system permease subunit
MGMYEFSLSRAIIRSKYTVILTLGAIMGVICLIVLTSLFNNYYLTSENIFMGIHPHIKIQTEGMSNSEVHSMAKKLKRRFPDIDMAKPALYKEVKVIMAKVHKKKFFCVKDKNTGKLKCFDEHTHTEEAKIQPRYGFSIAEKKKQTILLKGISVEKNETASGIKKIINGSLRLDDLNRNRDINGNPLPGSIYMQQDLFLGTVGLKDFLINFPETNLNWHHFLQKGTLSMGTQKEKHPLIVMSLDNARRCLGIGNIANTLEIKLNDPYKAEELTPAIGHFLGNDFKIENWISHSRGSFAFLRVIKIMIMTIIFSISVVAAIGMVSILTLIVMQNRSKIAILKSMGIKNSSIYKIFIFNTGLTGVTGVVTGVFLGLVTSRFLIHHFGDSLKKLGIKHPQISIEPQEILVIALMVIILFLLTAIIPSRRAINTDIVKGLQE